MSSEQLREGYTPRYDDFDEDHPVRRFTRGELKRDRGHLRLLSIFYYILGGLTVFGGLFTVIYVVMGIAMLTGSMGPPPPPTGLGYFLIGLGVVLFTMSETFGVCIVVAARSLATQKRYVFCFAVAIVLCLTGLLGLILGVFTIVVLARESVKEMFKRGPLALSTDEDYE